jgi:multidrug efflux system membrane fusion protein
MAPSSLSRRLSLGAAAFALASLGGLGLTAFPSGDVAADAGAPPAQATPVDVATVESRQVSTWTEFSGRLEAVDYVEVRSRVAGVIEAAHFREGALVQAGQKLFTIDRAPYEAEVDRAQAQVAAAEARVALAKSDLERGRKMTASETISQRDLDQRLNGLREAEANLKAARAVLKTAALNLDYTEVRAPISGRVGKIEITVGNLIAAGPGAPVLARLVSVDPIYASFDADESSVLAALDSVSAEGDRREKVAEIPVEMSIGADERVRGRLQLVGNVVDVASGTVRVRAAFDNADGRLIPGQFARLRLGQAKTSPALLVSERAVGVDQDKKFVLVVGGDDKAEWREVKLGATADGLRVVTEGLGAGERVVVNGLQKVRPGALLAPQPASMNAAVGLQKQASR